MDLEALFSIASTAALAGWIILLLRPLAPKLVDAVAGLALPLFISLIYTGLILAYWAGLEGGFDSLAAVRLLFTQDEAILAGWTHFLAFDLFVGALCLRVAQEEGVPHLAMIPALALTLYFGPIGLVATATLIAIARLTRRRGEARPAYS